MTGLAKRSVANRSKLITKSGFKGYDVCLNPYVGCEFGCAYCYVRFFIKDPDKEWGEFVRIRHHVEDKLPKELEKGFITVDNGTITHANGKKERLKRMIPTDEARLVLGTMTDPYQPVEKTYRVTRKALEILSKSRLNKIGIFTRSPLVLQDLELIKSLPRPRIHFTITPFQPQILRTIEPYSPKTQSRWKVVKKLKDAGIRVHANISPVIPTISEEFIQEYVQNLTEMEIDEYFVDPMQPYSESFEAFRKACHRLPEIDWDSIESTMLDKKAYAAWKEQFKARWNEERRKHQHKATNQLPIWSDHENHVWVNMITDEQMDTKNYGDDLNAV